MPKARCFRVKRIRPDDLKPRQTIDLGGGVEMAFRFIPRGEFRMGSRYGHPNEQPVHRVIIPEDFWLAETPVTQQQYARFDPDHRSYFHGSSANPVEEYNWHQTRKFCGWLKQAKVQWPWPVELAEFEPDLPTETQWEYACRAGADTDYHTGDGEQALARAGWYLHNSGGSTQEVRRKTPNAFGLYDMHGNLLEWCRDRWREEAYRHYAEGRIEPVRAGESVGESDDGVRLLRGGAWLNPSGWCRSAFRFCHRPDNVIPVLGFRVGLFPGPSCPVNDAGGVRPEGEGARRDAAQMRVRTGSRLAPGARW